MRLASRLTRFVLAFAALVVAATGVWAQTNPIVAENALPGTPPSQWDVPNFDPSIQGYATEMSVVPGETLGFKVLTPATDYRIDIYRLGYYQGLGARYIDTVQPSVPLPQTQPACLFDSNSKTVECGNWALSASWTVPAEAVSGIYVAKLVREDPEDGRASHIVFVVRDDERHSEILFQTSDATWQAYNHYLGYSLYSNPRSRKVSYNRPMVLRGNEPWDTVWNAEYPMLRWLERNGYDVSYSSGMDTDRRGSELLEHAIFMSVGHDEYWSRGQREAVTAARDAGVSLAFMSGNEIYWKTRWEPSLDGNAAPYRTLVCYKESQDPFKTDPLPGVWTGQWRDCRYGPHDGCQPENALSGQMSWTTTLCSGSACGIQVPADYAPMRLWRDTDIATLQPGQVAAFPPATLGFEWDYQQFDDSSPPGLVWLSRTSASGLTHHLSLYRHSSGALVFGTGTIQWAWGLDDNHTRARLPPINGGAPDARMQQLTVNVLAEMGVQPATLQAGLVAAVATGDVTPPSSTITYPIAGQPLLGGVAVIEGSASDTQGTIGVVEVSVDGGTTWKRAEGFENWTYAWNAPSHAGVVNLRSRAADDLGNVEIPSPGISVTVGGPPLELLSVAPDNSEYVNGQETAALTVLCQSNAAAASGLSVHVTLKSNLGDVYVLAPDDFAIGALGQHASEFSWPLPAASHPVEFSITAQLFRDGQLLETVEHKAAFVGMVMSHAELAQARDLVIEPSGCLAQDGACVAAVAASIPDFGTPENFATVVPILCKTRPELEAGHLEAAGACGLGASSVAAEVSLDALPTAGPAATVFPAALQAAIACEADLVAQGLEEIPAVDQVDTLAATVQSAFKGAGLGYSNEVFVSGPVELRIGQPGIWTSASAVAMRDVVVFPIGNLPVQWGHVGAQPVPLGSNAPNPHAVVAVQVRALATGAAELSVLHRVAPDSILSVHYAPFPVIGSKTVAHANFQDEQLYPWGFPLFVDTQGDGIDDAIYYPEGMTPSDAVPQPRLQFALLPSQPNPFNPTTTIRYVLPATGAVTVTVHDVRGRSVKTLFHGTQPAGLRSLEWNGADSAERRLPSGIYVVHVATPWGDATQKLVLIK